ncbi:DUF6404 family protein [Vibrio sp. SCSIO 43140]|uniref:DUF6404 family protein n=1 Tax=Vibrio TaxID=662 RepID=UPI0033657929
MNKEYSKKYSSALQELREHNISNLPYIRLLNYIGVNIRPFQYSGFIMSGLSIYPLWFLLFNFLVIIFGDEHLIGGYVYNAFFVPLLFSLISALFFLVQRKIYKLKRWEEL